MLPEHHLFARLKGASFTPMFQLSRGRAMIHVL